MMIPTKGSYSARSKLRAPLKASEPDAAWIASSIAYDPRYGLDPFVSAVSSANAVQLAEVERRGVSGIFLKDLSASTHLTFQRVSEILGIPRATAAEKARTGDPITGAGSHAAIGIVKLLARARQIAANSTSPDAQGFDVSRWLGEWIETPQPALGGRKPADLLDTPSGLEAVMRLLGALESGSYQ